MSLCFWCTIIVERGVKNLNAKEIIETINFDFTKDDLNDDEFYTRLFNSKNDYSEIEFHNILTAIKIRAKDYKITSEINEKIKIYQKVYKDKQKQADVLESVNRHKKSYPHWIVRTEKQVVLGTEENLMNKQSETDEELIDVLIAISVVSKRLANNLSKLSTDSQSQKGANHEQNERNVRSNHPVKRMCYCTNRHC